MAEVVSNLPIRERPDLRNEGRYPWDEWLDGRAWKLEGGKDFKQKPETFRMAVRTVAKRRGLKVKTRQVGKDVFIQAQHNATDADVTVLPVKKKGGKGKPK